MTSRIIIACSSLAACASLCAAPIPYASTDAPTVYLGAIADQDWGRPITSGDFDGDGYDEIVVAASESGGDVFSYVYIMRGGPGAAQLGVVNLLTGGVDQTVIGEQLNDNLGSSMTAGDFNGDGVDDLVLCASSHDYGTLVNCGMAYIIYGGEDFFASATRDLAEPGSWDMRIAGPVAGGDMGGYNLFGGLDAHSVAIGNLNGDKYGDLVLGVHLATGGAAQSGRVYVRYGAAFPSGFTLTLSSTSGYNVRIDGDGDGDELGAYVLTGDITGDGIDELILPTEWGSQGLFTSEGAVHIFRGGALPASHSLATTAAPITILGDRAYDYLGVAAGAGDFNGDGLGDLAIAATGADAGAYNNQRGDGFVYGLLGNPELATGTHLIDYAAATPDFLLIGDFEENLGRQLAVGDFNDDGYDDIAAGEWFGGPSVNGVVEVLFGRDFAPAETFTASVDTDIRITGETNDRISFSMASADVNNDGRDEIVFGTPFNNGSYPDEKGTVYVFDYVPGDFNHDGLVNLRDFAGYQVCFSSGVLPAVVAAKCHTFDYDLDGDIDLQDFAVLASSVDDH